MGGLIDDYLTKVITITPKGTLGGDGKYDFDGTDVITKACVMDTKKLVRNPAGTEIIADREFWVSMEDTLTVGDRITWSSINHEVVALRQGRFLDGTVNHQKAWVKVL